MALNSLSCADVPLSNYSLIHYGPNDVTLNACTHSIQSSLAVLNFLFLKDEFAGSCHIQRRLKKMRHS